MLLRKKYKQSATALQKFLNTQVDLFQRPSPFDQMLIRPNVRAPFFYSKLGRIGTIFSFREKAIPREFFFVDSSSSCGISQKWNFVRFKTVRWFGFLKVLVFYRVCVSGKWTNSKLDNNGGGTSELGWTRRRVLSHRHPRAFSQNANWPTKTIT